MELDDMYTENEQEEAESKENVSTENGCIYSFLLLEHHIFAINIYFCGGENEHFNIEHSCIKHAPPHTHTSDICP